MPEAATLKKRRLQNIKFFSIARLGTIHRKGSHPGH